MSDGLFESPTPTQRAPPKPMQGPPMENGLFKKISDSDLAIMGIEESIRETARARAVPPPEHLAVWNHPVNSTLSGRNCILAGNVAGSSDGGEATALYEHITVPPKSMMQGFGLPLGFGSYPKKNGRGGAWKTGEPSNRADIRSDLGKDSQIVKEPTKPAKNGGKKGSASTDKVAGE